MRLLKGDCLELMPRLADQSVDLILCDLPYGTTACSWDSVIPIKELWAEYRRLIKPCGVICLFGAEPFSTCLRMEAMDLYKYDWIWEKPAPTNYFHAKNMPMRAHEHISVFSGGSIGHANLLADKRMPYNPQGLTRVNRQVHRALNKPDSVYSVRPSHKTEFVQQSAGYPTSILRFGLPTNGRLHPSQKPVELLEYLIRTYTSRRQLVLDNCMGSGSTGVACVNTGRDFIGMELDPKYFVIASRRILGAREVRSNDAGRNGRHDAVGKVGGPVPG